MFTEKWLITRAKTDKNAFMELYNIYYPKLFSFLLVRTRNRELSEDITQETFVKAISALKNFQYKGCAFGSWLFKIAQNELISNWRKSGRELAVAPEEMEKTAGEVASADYGLIFKEATEEEGQRLKKLLGALDQLSPEEKNIVTMKYFSELSYKEISCFIKKRPTALAVELHRTLKKLREILEK